MSKRRGLTAFDNPLFIHSGKARTLRILSEYLEPEKRFEEFNILHTVVFFGSARISPHGGSNSFAKYYQAAEEFAYRLALLSDEIKEETGDYFYICTGGGPGIMEAANKGASRAEAKTIGLNIELPFEQCPNRYISPELSFEFHYFFMRKLWFLYQAKAIVVFPGGFGTFDELFETLTLVQTKKLEKTTIPILLYDPVFWKEVVNFDKLVEHDLILPEDLALFQYFSSVEEGIEILGPQLRGIMQNLSKYHAMKFPI